MTEIKRVSFLHCLPLGSVGESPLDSLLPFLTLQFVRSFGGGYGLSCLPGRIHILKS